MDSADIASKILRESGLGRSSAESLRAKENLDKRLDGLGLGPLSEPPVRIDPGRQAGFMGAGSAGTALLLTREGILPNPLVVPAGDLDSEASFEPADLVAAQAVTGLATTASGGTEVRFNRRGYIYVGSGAIGAYWNRALGANQNFRWSPLAPGLLIPYDPRQGFFVGTNTVGGIRVAGVLTLAFYATPAFVRSREDRSDEESATPAGQPSGTGTGTGTRAPPRPGPWTTERAWSDRLRSRLAASGSDNTAGALMTALGAGTDVTLGTFSDAGVGTQIFRASTNMPVGGAAVPGVTILNAPPDNTDAVWVGETGALAVARNGGINPAGQDSWHIPAGGTLFMLANSGTQRLGARYRS